MIESFDAMGDIDKEVLVAGLHKMAYADHREAFNAIKIPCLHIFGAKDRLVLPDLAKHLIQPPYHVCSVLQDSAHMPFLSEPENFKKVINLFLKNSN